MSEDEFEAFFRLMRPRLLRVAMRSLDVESANEVAISALHTIWTKAVPAATNQREQRQLQALAYRILDGHIRNAVRARARRARLLEAVAQDHLVGNNVQPDVADTVDHEAAESEVAGLLAGLGESEREVVALVIDGFKVNEIAMMLGRSPGAISMRLGRARKNLRKALERRVLSDA